MNRAVLDASAILAVIQQERGAEKLTVETLLNAVASTVNLSEVQAKLVKRGYAPDVAWADALFLESSPEPFTSEQARIAGSLIIETESRGLSFGDRACLALAIALKAEVYTTERAWKGLKVGVPIHVIR